LLLWEAELLLLLEGSELRQQLVQVPLQQALVLPGAPLRALPPLQQAWLHSGEVLLLREVLGWLEAPPLWLQPLVLLVLEQLLC
jgi:hypothetical protein